MPTVIVDETENLTYLFTFHEFTEIMILSLLNMFDC